MSRESVKNWYADKTEWLLSKYGPGPRVHFHTGLIPVGTQPGATADAIRRQLVASQEAMLERAARVWRAPETMTGAVVDIGCGLGGSALFFAERFGARVTAVSPVERHLGIVERFATEAGVGERVSTLCADAHEIPGAARFEAAYAIGASNYFDRPRWFAALAGLLAPRAIVGIEDTFAVDPELAAKFDAYWLSRIGTVTEYVAAAQAAGFHLVEAADVTAESAGFYDLSVAHSRALLREETFDASGLRKREASIAWQSEFADAYRGRKFEDRILLFARG